MCARLKIIPHHNYLFVNMACTCMYQSTYSWDVTLFLLLNDVFCFIFSCFILYIICFFLLYVLCFSFYTIGDVTTGAFQCKQPLWHEILRNFFSFYKVAIIGIVTHSLSTNIVALQKFKPRLALMKKILSKMNHKFYIRMRIKNIKATGFVFIIYVIVQLLICI